MSLFATRSVRRVAAAATTLALAGSALAMARPASAPAPSNRQLVEQKFRAWTAGTGSPYDLLAPDARWTIVGNSVASKSYPSRAAFIEEVIRPFNARLSAPLKPTIRGLYVDRDTVIALFDASGTARDGKPYRNTYSWYLRFRDGQIIEATAFFDSIAFNDLWTRVEPVTGT